MYTNVQTRHLIRLAQQRPRHHRRYISALNIQAVLRGFLARQLRRHLERNAHLYDSVSNLHYWEQTSNIYRAVYRQPPPALIFPSDARAHLAINRYLYDSKRAKLS